MCFMPGVEWDWLQLPLDPQRINVSKNDRLTDLKHMGQCRMHTLKKKQRLDSKKKKEEKTFSTAAAAAAALGSKYGLHFHQYVHAHWMFNRIAC